MSPEERQLLIGLFDRVRGAAANPRDREAEALIDDAVRAQPYAPYLLAQTVLVQEQALRAANDRLQQLEAEVRDLQQQASQPAGGGFLSGLGSLFGGGSPPPRSSVPPSGSPSNSPWQQSQGYNAPPPPPQSPWGQQQPQGGFGAPPAGPWGGQPQGGFGAPQSGGFLKGALGAAAGVAGGVLLADSIRNLMGGHNNGLGIADGLGGLGGGSRETVVNNYYNDDGSALRAQDAQQDADQDQDDQQDAGDYSDDYSNDA
jgi:hypothetical protein